VQRLRRSFVRKTQPQGRPPIEPVYESALSHIPAAACTHLSAPQAFDLPLNSGVGVVAIGVLTHCPVLVPRRQQNAAAPPGRQRIQQLPASQPS
jgi:hypothetical protein